MNGLSWICFIGIGYNFGILIKVYDDSVTVLEGLCSSGSQAHVVLETKR